MVRCVSGVHDWHHCVRHAQPFHIPSYLSTGRTFATLMCTPAAPEIMDAFDSHAKLYSVILVSIWELGEGIGVLIIASLSERFGRLPL